MSYIAGSFSAKTRQTNNRPESWGLHVAFAALIAAMIYVFALSGGSFAPLIVAQVVFVFWVILTIAVTRHRVVTNKKNIVLLLILAAVLVSNILANIDNYARLENMLLAITHMIGILLFAIASIWASSNLCLPYALKLLSWLILPVILFALAFGWSEAGGGRAMPLGLHPNWWGEVAFGFILCAIALDRSITRHLFIALGLVLMYMVQSRGALLGALVALASFWLVQHRSMSRTAARNLALLGAVTIICFVGVLVSGIWIPIVDFLVSEVLLLDNPYRGVDSNLTDRLDGYVRAIAIFVDSPIFGQGFDTLLDVHNGFLRWAGEGGILLLGTMTYLMTSAIMRAWRCRNNWALAALLGIAAYMLTYPRALNLNLVGLLFLVALFNQRDSRSENGRIRLTIGNGMRKDQPSHL